MFPSIRVPAPIRLSMRVCGLLDFVPNIDLLPLIFTLRERIAPALPEPSAQLNV